MAENGEEKLSKNELKRRMKAEKKAAEKAEKAEKAQPEANSKKLDKLADEEISPNEYFKIRGAAVEELKTQEGQHPYPHKYDVTTSLTEFVDKYQSVEDGTTRSEVTLRVAGRLHAIRESGAKLIFYDLRGEGTKVQVMANAKIYRDGEEAFLQVRP